MNCPSLKLGLVVDFLYWSYGTGLLAALIRYLDKVKLRGHTCNFCLHSNTNDHVCPLLIFIHLFLHRNFPYYWILLFFCNSVPFEEVACLYYPPPACAQVAFSRWQTEHSGWRGGVAVEAEPPGRQLKLEMVLFKGGKPVVLRQGVRSPGSRPRGSAQRPV